jgi:hypothetical protein
MDKKGQKRIPYKRKQLSFLNILALTAPPGGPDWRAWDNGPHARIV